MTELMKMYEKRANPVTVPAFLVDEYNQLKLENIALKDQLRWRSADIPPNVDGLYVVTKRDESPRLVKSYHLVRFKNGEWKVDLFSGGYVYSYFNVPIPEPNEE